MEHVASILRTAPSLGVFIALCLGFWLGRLRLGRFSLGTVVCTLLVGVLVGQSGAAVSAEVQGFFFSLFLFAIGYKVGPQFFQGLRREAIPQFVLTFVLAATAVATALGAAHLLGYDKGTAAGLFAGATTQSSAIGSAGDAIRLLDLPEPARRTLLDNLAVAYAVTYVFGTAGLAFFLSRLGGRLAGGELRAACRAEAQRLAGEEGPEVSLQSAYSPLDYRAFRATGAPFAGRTVAEIESEHRGLLTIERVRRASAGGAIEDATPALRIAAGDVVAVAVQRSELLGGGFDAGPEVDDRELLDFPLETLDVVVTARAIDGMTLERLLATHGRGVRAHRLLRVAHRVPLLPGTLLARGDLIGVIGARRDVERFAAEIGYPDRGADSVDMVYVGLGLAIGVLAGLPTLRLGAVALGLGAAGAIAAGLVFGFLRARHPTFGRFPASAEWVFETLGLHIFVAIVGLNSGPAFVEGLRRDALSLLLAGVVVTLVPHAVTLLCGRFLFRINPGVLVGVSAGAGASSASLLAIEEEAQSAIPVLGYSITYAVGTVLLTAGGAIMVALV